MSVFGGHGKGFGGGDGDAGSVSLNLTALMDILSNLLFFLLASYTAQALEVEQKADLHLPSSTSQAKLTPNLTIRVTTHDIKAADVPVAKVENSKIVGSPEEGDKIVALYDRLSSIRKMRQAAGKDDLQDADVVLLLADRATDAILITKVLKTCGMAGFVNVRFGVISK
jgi:biopolymer transport protein ExbD